MIQIDIRINKNHPIILKVFNTEEYSGELQKYHYNLKDYNKKVEISGEVLHETKTGLIKLCRNIFEQIDEKDEYSHF